VRRSAGIRNVVRRRAVLGCTGLRPTVNRTFTEIFSSATMGS
jgi:hypothetical protein